jgi:K+-sensing histidine kinase KdpD
MTTVNTQTASVDSTSVAWADFVRFVRQLSHDLRNHLNAAELQSAYLEELATNAEIKAEVRRLREMTAQLSAVLQKLSADVARPKPNSMTYGAAEFVEDIRRKLGNTFPKEAPGVEWDVQLENNNLQIDPQLMQEALLEIFSNAFRHRLPEGSLNVSARVEGGSFVFTLREPKQQFDLPTDRWGHEPLHRVTQGHYALGLNRVRAIVESHGGQVNAQYDPSSAILATTISLPLSAGAI